MHHPLNSELRGPLKWLRLLLKLIEKQTFGFGNDLESLPGYWAYKLTKVKSVEETSQ